MAPSRFELARSRMRDSRAFDIQDPSGQPLNAAEPESNDPNDPRNWPLWHRDLTLMTICLFSFMANVNASAFNMAVRPIMMYFHCSATQATLLTALNVLMFGLGNLLWVPLMRVIGKRPVYLSAIVVLIVANAWSAKAHSYGSLLAARMVSGLGAAAADATVPSAVADMYVHKMRGFRMMMFHFALTSGIFLSPVINAWVIQLHGWRWVPGWMAIVFGFILLLGIALIHETEYRSRRLLYASDEVPTKRSFAQWLSLTIARERKQPLQRLWQTLKDIVVMTVYPQVLWAAILCGLFTGWAIIVQITIAQTFGNPRGAYRWPIGKTGLINLSGWIGILFAVVIAGTQLDKEAKRRAEKLEDGAVAHAENRLRLLTVPFALAPTGLIIYGVCLAKQDHWIAPAIGYALHSFGFAAVSNIVVTYATDCHLKRAGEGMVSLFVIRNVIAVICSFYCNPWIARDGMPAVSM